MEDASGYSAGLVVREQNCWKSDSLADSALKSLMLLVAPFVPFVVAILLGSVC